MVDHDIRLVGPEVALVHNGKKVLDKVHIDGLTAIANNADEGKPGPFIVEGDHSNVDQEPCRDATRKINPTFGGISIVN